METLKAILMGLVQGVTEFLPISSSGHLAIMRHVLHMQLDDGALFDVMLHFGTLVAVIVAFRKDIWKLICEFFNILLTCLANLLIAFKRINNKSIPYIKVISTTYRKLVVMIIISTIPTGILGIVGGELVEKASEYLIFTGVCLFITAALLIVADFCSNGKDKIKDVPYSGAFLLGIAQGIATLPGISRSGTTISCGMMIGMSRKTAVRYSFIMSIPAILGAVVVKIADIGKEKINPSMIPGYVLGTITAGIVGFLSIKFLIGFIKNKKYFGFAIYCFALGIVAIAYSIMK